jgi:hypothetical protein
MVEKNGSQQSLATPLVCCRKQLFILFQISWGKFLAGKKVYTVKKDKDPKVIIPLEGLSIRENNDYTNKHCFELFDPNNHKIKSCKLGNQGPVEGENLWELWLMNLRSTRSIFVASRTCRGL